MASTDLSVVTSSHLTLPDLPEDIFLLVLQDLDAWDVVRCQRVSRAWRHTFVKESYLHKVLRKYPLISRIQPNKSNRGGENVAFNDFFNGIARRYYHLRHGKVGSVARYGIRSLDQEGYWSPVGQWEYHESQPGGRLYYENAVHHVSRLGNKPYLFRPSLWSYDDGLLACALSRHVDEADTDDRHKGFVLSIVDVESGKIFAVPFRITKRIIRGVSLRNRALVVEWAEREPFHDLNDSERVHRHFATCFDVCRTSGEGGVECKVSFRNEWKMHFLGLPLNLSDRFFSIHNGIHYAVYFWQPNRSMYTGDEDMPIEALCVGDISSPSPHRPSLDPASRHAYISTFSFRDLDFLGVRQHANISLMSLELDSVTCSLTIRENESLAGQGYFDPAERPMCATVTTFPFSGAGPVHRRRWTKELPPYRGHCSMDSVQIECQEKWFLPVMDVYDAMADVRFSLVETCFTGMSAENRLVVRIKSLGEWVSLEDGLVTEVARMGRIAGDERWLVGQNASMELVVLKF